jgi:hypothetical protein
MPFDLLVFSRVKAVQFYPAQCCKMCEALGHICYSIIGFLLFWDMLYHRGIGS